MHDQISVLFKNSFFPELYAQPGRACLLHLTPELDHVLVSLANNCLGASHCPIECKILELNFLEDNITLSF